MIPYSTKHGIMEYSNAVKICGTVNFYGTQKVNLSIGQVHLVLARHGRCNRLLGPPDFESADQKFYEPLIAKGFIILVLLVHLRILSLS